MYEKMDTFGAKKFRSEFDEELKAIGAKFGLELSIGTIRYDVTGSLTTKLTAKIPVFHEAVQEIKKESTMNRFGFTRTVSPDGYTFVEYNPRKYKYPFIVEKNGKRYKMSQFNAKVKFGG